VSHEIEERDGTRGGEYFVVRLSNNRQVAVSRKPGDERVWLGYAGDPSSYAGQRGGAGTIDHLLDDLRGRLAAASPDELELYSALSDLRRRRDNHLAGGG
jgi:hypothetical protein